HTDVHASKQNVKKQALRRTPRKVLKTESKDASEHKNKDIVKSLSQHIKISKDVQITKEVRKGKGK
ncbi:OLC1v1005746C1, partial [Oldenlandia corymbosa var. corymbosa]